ncbi:MAG: serine hydrolase, partial [Kangiellaceae bacterium]|nr:serine hydrolase [Kangiellaceae bacterium]
MKLSIPFQSNFFNSKSIFRIDYKSRFIGFLIFTGLLVILTSSSLSYASSPNNIDLLKQIENKIEKNEFKQITSVLVQHKGQLVYENYFNNGSPEYLNNIRSASKSLTALLLGNSIQDGLLASEHEPVLKYISPNRPAYNSFPNKEKITFQDLLTMSSSLECNDWEQHSVGNE